MNNKKGTKRALLSSVLALVLCFSMLVGTTFAWFTDSVTSGKNTIVAGNLDIELEYWNGTTWLDVANSTELFDESALWEPGYTQIVYLRLSNKGNLDIKYQLGMKIISETPSINVNGKAFALSDYIYYGVVEGLNGETSAYPLTTEGRDDAVADVEAGAKTLSTGTLNVGTMTEVDEVLHLALVVYMPTWVDNDANYDKQYDAPTIELGINAVATQLASEKDSFGADYDLMAPWTGLAADVPAADANNVITITTGEQLAGVAKAVNAGNSYQGYTIQLGADIDLNNIPWTPIGAAGKNFNGSFDGNGKTIFNLNVSGVEGVGLIGFAGNAAHIEDVSIDNATVSGNHWVGTVLGYGYLAANTLKDCVVKNATVICTPQVINGVYDDGDKVGIIAGMAINGNILNNSAEDCVVIGYRDMGGIVGCAQAEDRDIEVSGNTVKNITIVYTDVLGEYAGGKPNQNMNSFVGRTTGSKKVTIGTNYGESSCYEVVATVVSEASELATSLANGGHVVLVSDIQSTAPSTIPEGVEATLYLNGKKITGSISKDAGSVLENNGTLTIVGDGSGVITNEVVNGGSIISNTGTLVLDGANIAGAPMGSTGYPAYTVYTTGSLTVEAGTTITADRGVISMSNGAEVVINGGKFVVSDAADGRNMTLHTIYAYGYDSKLTIHDGYFEQDHTSTGGASVICPAGATIDIYGGEFRDAMDDNTWTSTGNFQNYMGYGAPVNVYGGSFDDATVNKNLASGYKSFEENGVYYVLSENIDKVTSDVADLDSSLLGGEDVALSDDVELSTEDTNAHNGYGKTGLAVSGNVFDGNGKTLTVNNADGTWDSAVYTNGGTIRNLTVNGAFRGIFTGGLTSDLYIDNVTVDDVCYTIHADGSTRSAYSLIVTNSTLNGWTSYSDVFKSVSFTNCNFGQGTGGYKYAYARPYNDTVFTNCVFEEGFAFDATRCTSIFVNCYYGDKLITAENVTELLGSSAANIKFASSAPSEKATIVEAADQAALDSAKIENNSVVILPAGNFIVPDSAQGKTVTFIGNGDTVVATQDDGSYEGCDYSLDGSTATFEGIVINTNSATYTGYARLNATYNNCTINGCYTLYGTSVFNNCTFNVSGDVYNIWTWGAPIAEFNDCTFNTSGKAILAYGGTNTVVKVTNCTFNDDNAFADVNNKAAIEVGSDWSSDTKTIIATNCTVNGFDITNKGTNTGSTLWGNKNSLSTERLNVVIDGTDVY